jgi:hypothetical protein
MLKIIIAFIFSLSFVSCVNESKQIKMVELGTTKKNYIKDVSWGMAGDNSRFYIGSTNKIEDTISDPFYSEDFFYKLENDTFYVYTRYSAVRKYKWNATLNLKEIFLSNPDTTNLIENYKKFNLKYSLWD